MITLCLHCKLHGHAPQHVAELTLFANTPSAANVCWCCWFNYAFEVVPMFDLHQAPNVVRGPAYDRRVRTCELISEIVQYEDYVRSEDYVRAVYLKRRDLLEEIAVRNPRADWRAFYGTPG